MTLVDSWQCRKFSCTHAARHSHSLSTWPDISPGKVLVFGGHGDEQTGNLSDFVLLELVTVPLCPDDFPVISVALSDRHTLALHPGSTSEPITLTWDGALLHQKMIAAHVRSRTMTKRFVWRLAHHTPSGDIQC